MGQKIFQRSSWIQPNNCRIGCSANPSTLTPSRVRMAYSNTISWIRSNSSQAGRLYYMLTSLNSTLPHLLIVLKMLTRTEITRLDWDCVYGNNQIGILKQNKEHQIQLKSSWQVVQQITLGPSLILAHLIVVLDMLTQTKITRLDLGGVDPDLKPLDQASHPCYDDE